MSKSEAETRAKYLAPALDDLKKSLLHQAFIMAL
jgi:hypothetical protein